MFFLRVCVCLLHVPGLITSCGNEMSPNSLTKNTFSQTHTYPIAHTTLWLLLHNVRE